MPRKPLAISQARLAFDPCIAPAMALPTNRSGARWVVDLPAAWMPQAPTLKGEGSASDLAFDFAQGCLLCIPFRRQSSFQSEHSQLVRAGHACPERPA